MRATLTEGVETTELGVSSIQRVVPFVTINGRGHTVCNSRVLSESECDTKAVLVVANSCDTPADRVRPFLLSFYVHG